MYFTQIFLFDNFNCVIDIIVGLTFQKSIYHLTYKMVNKYCKVSFIVTLQ